MVHKLKSPAHRENWRIMTEEIKLVFSPSGANINLSVEPLKSQGLHGIFTGRGSAGKTNFLCILADEGKRNGIPFVMYDWSGDTVGVRNAGNVVVVGDVDRDGIRKADFDIEKFGDIKLALQSVYDDEISIVFDFSALNGFEERIDTFARMMTIQYMLAERCRKPVLTLIDEAHHFAPQKKVFDAQKESYKALWMMLDSRKYGLLLFLATGSSTMLAKEFIRPANFRIFGTMHDMDELKVAAPYLPDKIAASRLENSGVSIARYNRLGAESILPELWAGQVLVRSLSSAGLEQITYREDFDLSKTPDVSVLSGRVKKDGVDYYLRVKHSYAEITAMIEALPFRTGPQKTRVTPVAYETGVRDLWSWLNGGDFEFPPIDEIDESEVE